MTATAVMVIVAVCVVAVYVLGALTIACLNVWHDWRVSGDDD